MGNGMQILPLSEFLAMTPTGAKWLIREEAVEVKRF